MDSVYDPGPCGVALHSDSVVIPISQDLKDYKITFSLMMVYTWANTNTIWYPETTPITTLIQGLALLIIRASPVQHPVYPSSHFALVATPPRRREPQQSQTALLP